MHRHPLVEPIPAACTAREEGPRALSDDWSHNFAVMRAVSLSGGLREHGAMFTSGLQLHKLSFHKPYIEPAGFRPSQPAGASGWFRHTLGLAELAQEPHNGRIHDQEPKGPTEGPMGKSLTSEGTRRGSDLLCRRC